MEDKRIACKGCGEEFIFTAGEQGFYLEKGLLNDPERCLSCRAQRRRDKAAAARARNTCTVACAQCGRDTTVPFVPRLNKPVYCIACFQKVRSGISA